MIWGAVAMIGFGATYADVRVGFFWPLIAAAGALASLWVGMRQARELSPYSWRNRATFIALFGFVAGVFVLLPPIESRQTAAFFPYATGFAFILTGVWSRLHRLAWLGLFMAVATLVVYAFLPAYFLLAMAIAGGAAVVLGGYWLRGI